ncbi:hypothetical protein SDC9_205777 [bioreactor metagenome]|uniref:Uncharacterized protein n=1 Tax=bioreactor metagenome TaxID=1076179 RepID=A0A645J3Q4_9ZZZZ
MRIIGLPSRCGRIERKKLDVLQTEHQGSAAASDVLVVYDKRGMGNLVLACRTDTDHMLGGSPLGNLNGGQVVEFLGCGKAHHSIMDPEAHESASTTGDDQCTIAGTRDCTRKRRRSTCDGNFSCQRTFRDYGAGGWTGHGQVGSRSGCKDNRIAALIVFIP